MTADGRIVRGTIDCLVAQPRTRDHRLEFKTGRPRPEHQSQVGCIAELSETIFPGVSVDARLVYLDAHRGRRHAMGHSISRRTLRDCADAEECVSDLVDGGTG